MSLTNVKGHKSAPVIHLDGSFCTGTFEALDKQFGAFLDLYLILGEGLRTKGSIPVFTSMGVFLESAKSVYTLTFLGERA
jgi:hypothetical protein